MAKKRMFLGMLAMALVVGMFTTGCATRLGDFTLLSSKNVELSRLGEFTRSKKVVRGSDSKVTLLFFIPITKEVDLKKALDNALNKIPGAQAIVDVRIDYQKLNFLLFQIDGYVVSGTALVDPGVADASETTADKPYLVMDTKDGEHFTKRYVSESEYQNLLARVK
jgi:hypothetical protein